MTALLESLRSFGLVEGFWRWGTTSMPLSVFLVALSFVLHGVAYAMTCLQSFIMPRIPWLQQFKIQKDKPAPTWQDAKKVLGVVIPTQVFLEIPLYCAIPVYVHFTGMPYEWDQIPPWTVYVWKCAVALIIEDAWHYWAHRLLHVKSLYWIHKMHHEYKSPFTMTAEYAHPLETMILGTGFFVAVVVLCDHCVFLFIWLFARMVQTADVHSGYDGWWNPLNWIPFYGGARAHDMHHRCFKGNYSSTFTWWDKICGTAISDQEIDRLTEVASQYDKHVEDTSKKGN